MKSMLPCLVIVAVATLSAAPTARSQTAAPPPLAAEQTPSTEPWPAPATAARDRDSAQPWVRIEQVRRGNRIVEVRITDPAGETRYTMVNREGRPPTSAQELSSGLSTPRFFRFDF